MSIETSKVHVEVWNEWYPLRHVIVGRADGASIPSPEPAFMARVPTDSDLRGHHRPRTQEAISATISPLSNGRSGCAVASS